VIRGPSAYLVSALCLMLLLWQLSIGYSLGAHPASVQMQRSQSSHLLYFPTLSRRGLVASRFQYISQIPGRADGIAVEGEYAYIVAVNEGLRIIDVSNPMLPREVAHYDGYDDTLGRQLGYAADIVVRDSYAYIADVNTGLWILDVNNPRQPRLIDRDGSQIDAVAIDIEGDFIYQVDNDFGLGIYDISDPSQTRLVGFVDIGTSYDVFAREGLAYVTGEYEDTSAVYIIDVSQPTKPAIISVIPARAGSVYADDRYAYVVSPRDGLSIYDIQQPASPVLVSELYVPGAIRLVRSGSQAFIGARQYGVRALDISNVTNPGVVAAYDTEGIAINLFVHNRQIFIADRDSGLLILELQEVEAR
jgi:hypothetical protein